LPGTARGLLPHYPTMQGRIPVSHHPHPRMLTCQLPSARIECGSWPATGTVPP